MSSGVIFILALRCLFSELDIRFCLLLRSARLEETLLYSSTVAFLSAFIPVVLPSRKIFLRAEFRRVEEGVSVIWWYGYAKICKSISSVVVMLDQSVDIGYALPLIESAVSVAEAHLMGISISFGSHCDGSIFVGLRSIHSVGSLGTKGIPRNAFAAISMLGCCLDSVSQCPLLWVPS